MIQSHPSASTPSVTNSVPNSTFLRHLTDDQIREGIEAQRDTIIGRAFPGVRASGEGIKDLRTALKSAGALFEVEKHPIMIVNHVDGLDNPDAGITPYDSKVATVRTDTMATLGIVGADYGVVQTLDAMSALDILSDRGDVRIMSVRNIDSGARVQVVALLGQTCFPSDDGSPNTLGHFAIFEATHDMSACTTATVFTLRLECFNGMTSREVVTVHKLRHTKNAGARMEAITVEILESLLGDVEAEIAIFKSLVSKRITALEFESFATDLLGGALKDDASQALTTRRENEVKELTEYFQGGNQGAGPTAWGAYNSATRWVEAKREALADAAANAGKFDSNVSGTNQNKIARALRLAQAL